MPYRSDAQRRFFHTKTARKRGITQTIVDEFDDESRGKKLPEKKHERLSQFNKKKRRRVFEEVRHR